VILACSSHSAFIHDLWQCLQGRYKLESKVNKQELEAKEVAVSVEKHCSILHQKLQGNVRQKLVQFQLCANTLAVAM
jgi:hypothetical protein